MKKKTLKQQLEEANEEIVRLNNTLVDANRRRAEAFIDAYFKKRYDDIAKCRCGECTYHNG